MDRQTFAGMAGMYAFRVSFRYDAVPLAAASKDGAWTDQVECGWRGGMGLGREIGLEGSCSSLTDRTER